MSLCTLSRSIQLARRVNDVDHELLSGVDMMIIASIFRRTSQGTMISTTINGSIGHFGETETQYSTHVITDN